MNLFSTARHVRELREEVRALTQEQRRTNELLSQILEQNEAAAEDYRSAAASGTQYNAHLSTVALSVAMVSFVVGLMAVFAELPNSPITIVGIIAAGMVILMFLGVAVQHAVASWRLRQHLDLDRTPSKSPQHREHE